MNSLIADIQRIAPGRRQNIAIELISIATRIAAVALCMTNALCLVHYPWKTDTPLSVKEMADLEGYYAKAYAQPSAGPGVEEDPEYVRIAAEAAKAYNVKGRVESFARTYGLADKKVLDVGAGRGYLQDVVNDYVGLDISPTARRFFHKPFVHGSATHMPLRTNEFDAAWSICVLEHVPNPEAALSEIRRVVRDDGLLYLNPAWNCTPWAAQGYPVRPYSSFDLKGKVIKAVYPIEYAAAYLSRTPVRMTRYALSRLAGGPTRFRYTLLEPNYREYYMPDSDALNSLDRYEMALWFTSRGDECLNCTGFLNGIDASGQPLMIRIHKKGE